MCKGKKIIGKGGKKLGIFFARARKKSYAFIRSVRPSTAAATAATADDGALELREQPHQLVPRRGRQRDALLRRPPIPAAGEEVLAQVDAPDVLPEARRGDLPRWSPRLLLLLLPAAAAAAASLAAAAASSSSASFVGVVRAACSVRLLLEREGEVAPAFERLVERRGLAPQRFHRRGPERDPLEPRLQPLLLRLSPGQVPLSDVEPPGAPQAGHGGEAPVAEGQAQDGGDRGRGARRGGRGGARCGGNGRYSGSLVLALEDCGGLADGSRGRGGGAPSSRSSSPLCLLLRRGRGLRLGLVVVGTLSFFVLRVIVVVVVVVVVVVSLLVVSVLVLVGVVGDDEGGGGGLARGPARDAALFLLLRRNSCGAAAAPAATGARRASRESRRKWLPGGGNWSIGVFFFLDGGGGGGDPAV